MNLTSYDCGHSSAQRIYREASHFDLSQAKEKRIFEELEAFKEKILGEKVLHPFDALTQLDQAYLRYIKNEGRPVARAFVFDQENSYKIFNYLLTLSRLYLAKNKTNISERRLRHNWIFLLAMSLPLICKGVPYNEHEFDKQIADFLKNNH